MPITAIRFAVFSFGVTAIIFFLMSLFFVQWHDWDIDAFLYIGSRLWHGELLYFHEYETKLPPLQYIFALASAFGGIGAWRIMTMLISLVLGFWGSYVLAREFIKLNLASLGLVQVTLLCLTFFLLLLYSLPGSESAHIEMLAASAAYVSFAFTLSIGSAFSYKNLIFGGFFLALAASIRPNFIYIIPLIPIYLLVCDGRLFRETKSQSMMALKLASFRTFIYLFIFGATVGALLLPYFISENGVFALIDGLIALASYSEDFGFKRLIATQLSERTATFYLSLYVASGMLLFLVTNRSYVNNPLLSKYVIFSLLCIAAINLSLLRTHYWGHNSIMFVPYAVPVFLLLFNLITGGRVEIRHAGMHAYLQRICYGVFSLILVTPSMQLFSHGREVLKNRVDFNQNINDRGIDHKLLDYLDEEKQSFLVMESPIYHMILQEKRIGDGHPAMLGRVFSGKRLGPVGDIYLFSDEVFSAPCVSLLRSNKTLIITAQGSVFADILKGCINEENGTYKRINVTGLDNYIVFKLELP